MKVTNTALRRPVTVIVLTLALVYFGIYAYFNMGMEQTPDVDLPVVMVTTTMRGATAAVMDNDVTDVLEEQINTISGIESLSSSSYMGAAVTVIEFDMERDIDAAAADVRDKVNAAKANLPSEADEPLISKLDINDSPVVMFSVTGPAPYRDKVYFVDKVAKVKLQSINGVGNINTPGLRDREIRVWIDPVRLRSRGLVVQDLSNAIASKHVELPAGSLSIDRFKMDLRIEGEYSSVEEMKSLPITTRNGVVIRLGDVADVEDGFEELSNTAYDNGQQTILVAVQKQRGANEVATCDAVLKGFEEIKKLVPEGMNMELVYNKSDFIKRSMKGVATDVVQAVALCSLLMLFFLQTFRATFVTVISMPVCLIGSFVAMKGFGVTINNLSMMGISLAVGMVVDATTVILENVDHHMKQGMLPFDAAQKGTDEVAFSVLGGSLTTIGVFAPVAFMGGIIGRFFFHFGITVVVTITLSLILAMTLTPFLCSRLLVNRAPGQIARFCDGLLGLLEKGYRKVLSAAVHHKTVTIAIALAVFAGGIVIAGKVGTAFQANDDNGMFMIKCELQSGTEIEETGRVLESMSEVLRRNKAVRRTMFGAGVDSGSESNKGTIYVDLVPRQQRNEQKIIMEECRAALKGFRDVIMNFQTWGGKDCEMVLSGAQTEKLIEVAKLITADMAKTGDVRDIETDVRLDKPQVNVHIDRNMTDAMNVDVRSLSTEIQAYFGGVKAGVYKEGGFRYDIRLMARRDNRRSLDDLQIVSFKNGQGDIVQAPGLITMEKVLAPSVVKRYNRQTSLTISCNAEKHFSPGQAMTLIEELAEKHIPQGEGISIQPSGRTKSQQDNFARLLNVLIIAISLVYIIMCVQFESFLHPFTVMFSLPLMTPGTFLMLYLLDCRLDVMAYMGIILLVGIVVNNGIILVDFINQNRLRGMDKVAAAIDAGPRRLRAILITSLSTMIGAIPAALKLSEGSESRQPMSAALFGGLFTSTLLTLLVIPVMYIVLDNIKEFFGRKLFQKALP
jgi:HAE1 family hydrophobic/amphiphilic exporter-1